MGRYAQSKRRGADRDQRVPPLRAPVLRLDDPDVLQWTFADPQPETWHFDSSVDGVSEWEGEGEASGDATFFEPAPNHHFWRMIGWDAVSTPITSYSNIVLMSNG